eukprot:14720462-Alexandrium_andersonii.AAC.1
MGVGGRVEDVEVVLVVPEQPLGELHGAMGLADRADLSRPEKGSEVAQLGVPLAGVGGDERAGVPEGERARGTANSIEGIKGT